MIARPTCYKVFPSRHDKRCSRRRNAAPAAELDDVFFSYPGVPIFDGVSFQIPYDGLTQIVGPNGGGQTTFARLLLGLLRPHSGAIRVLGVSAPAARRRIGYVPQHALHDPQFPALAFEVVMTGLLSRSFGPFRRIDRDSAVRLENLILSQKTRVGIMLITHDFDFLSGAVDRVLCVNRNAHIHERSSLSDHDLQRLFTGHFHKLAEVSHG